MNVPSIYIALAGAVNPEVAEKIIEIIKKAAGEDYEVRYWNPEEGPFNPEVPTGSDMLILVPAVEKISDPVIPIGRGLHSILYDFVVRKQEEGKLKGLLDTLDPENRLEHSHSPLSIPLIVRTVKDDKVFVDVIHAARLVKKDWKLEYAHIGCGGNTNFHAITLYPISDYLNAMP